MCRARYCGPTLLLSRLEDSASSSNAASNCRSLVGFIGSRLTESVLERRRWERAEPLRRPGPGLAGQVGILCGGSFTSK